ncbi:hypothetical protein QR685DRAFT_431000 [Neurospora intermedia]|uniref:Uncharacterized protein n=1 Tax=Neurospora intermedia TaxID=5142 RepID=A0ABR3DSJ4_NEUIN
MRRSFVRRWRSRRRSRRLGDEQYSIRLNLSDRSRRVVRSDKTVAQVGEVVALSGRLRLKLKPQRRDAVTVTVWTVRSDRREVKREDEEKRPTPLDAKRGLICASLPWCGTGRVNRHQSEGNPQQCG